MTKHLPWKVASIILLFIIFIFSKEWSEFIFESVKEKLSVGDKSELFYADLLHLINQEVIWWLFFGWLAWVIHDYLEKNSFEGFRFPIGNQAGFFVLPALVLILGILLAKFILMEFPNSSDEYVYLFQAETLSQGKLLNKPHPLHQFFTFNHLFQNSDVWIGRFPPGWPLILSGAYFLKIPEFMINPILGALTLWVFFLFVRYRYTSQIAWWSVVCMGLSSFFLFNSASFFSHSLAMLCALLFAFFLLKYLDSQKVLFGLLAGFFIGLSFVTRYYTAILISLPFIFYVIPKGRSVFFKTLAVTFIGFLPWLVCFLVYNYLTTGNALLPVTVWVDPHEGLGFVKGHTLFQGIEHVIRRLLLFVYWTSPGLIILYGWFLIGRLSGKKDMLRNPEGWSFIVLIIGYFFYYEIGGNQYGPRFYYEAFPFLVAFVVSQVMKQNQGLVIRAFFFAGLIYGIIKFPFIAEREHRVITERLDLYRQVEQKHIHQAVVFVSSPTGVIRPMPIGDLLRNDKAYQNDVIYARDLGEENTALIEFYPNRSFYRYTREPDTVAGRLELIRSAIF